MLDARRVLRVVWSFRGRHDCRRHREASLGMVEEAIVVFGRFCEAARGSGRVRRSIGYVSPFLGYIRHKTARGKQMQ